MQRLARILQNTWVDRTVRTVIAGMFLAAGIIKIQDPATFAAVIEAFGLVPPPLPGLLAAALPVVEIIAAVLLLFNRKSGLAAITGLTVLFLLVLLYGLSLGLDVDCGCYGPGDPEGAAFSSLRTAFYRDLGIMAGLAYLYWFRWGRKAAP